MNNKLLPPDIEAATQHLGRYISTSRYEDLPSTVVHEGIRALVNLMGCAIGGANHESVDMALGGLLPFSGAPQASIAGRTERTDCLLAALVNGISSHVLDFDDTHPEILLHPSGPIAAALFPLAEFRGASGRDFLNAFVVGVEVECRVARAIQPSHYENGWHMTGTAGIFGAAAACARLLGLDATQCTWALGIAAAQSAGLREMFGSMCKSLHVGRAAQGGLTAALLAQRGFTSSNTALEGTRGFIHVLSTTPTVAALTANLNEDWELMRNTYKPYACGLVIHPSLDGCIQLRTAHGLRAEDIDRIELVVHPLALELTGKRTPSSGLEGKFSVFHGAAIAIIDGAGGEVQFSDARVTSPDVVALRTKVQAHVDPAMGQEQAAVTVWCKNGARHSLLVEHCAGSLGRPLSDSEINNKFLGLSEPVLGQGAHTALAALRELPNFHDAGQVALHCAITA